MVRVGRTTRDRRIGAAAEVMILLEGPRREVGIAGADDAQLIRIDPSGVVHEQAGFECIAIIAAFEHGNGVLVFGSVQVITDNLEFCPLVVR